jgi:hypothetical protein
MQIAAKGLVVKICLATMVMCALCGTVGALKEFMTWPRDSLDSVIKKGLDELRKHNSFGNNDVMVYGHCRNRHSTNYLIVWDIVGENSVSSIASHIDRKMRENDWCEDGKVFLMTPDGKTKRLGK